MDVFSAPILDVYIWHYEVWDNVPIYPIDPYEWKRRPDGAPITRGTSNEGRTQIDSSVKMASGERDKFDPSLQNVEVRPE